MKVSNYSIRLAIVIFWFVAIFTFVTRPSFWSFSEGKSINVCAWSGMIDLQWVSRFEKQTGIRVNISYYESNEELLVKLGANKAHGYDLIVPSDYALHILRKKGMLKKIDKRKIDFYDKLNPLLMHHYFDPRNDYSLPYEWSVYGLGINTTCYPEGIPIESWGLVFSEDLIGSHVIMMTNDPLVAIPLAAFYLFGTMENVTPKKMRAIKNCLKEQHRYVEAYTDFRASYYLASKNACIAVCPSSYILKSMQRYKHLDFIIPKEGSLLTIENFALPAATKKDDLVYRFMNFMMEPESVVRSFEHIGSFPATIDVLDKLAIGPKVHALLTMNKKEFERFQLLRLDLLKESIYYNELQDLWVRVKA